MNVLKIILKVLLTIIRVPFTIWYVVLGLVFKFFLLYEIAAIKLGVMQDHGTRMDFFVAITTFEWASLVKFYHFHW